MTSYQYEQLSPHIYRIKDPLGVFLYLVCGSTGACLLDSGYGLGNLKEAVQKITLYEPMVILTHGHIDHIGGSAAYTNVYMNPKDINVYKKHCTKAYRHDFFEENKNNFPDFDEALLKNPKPIEQILPYHDGDRFNFGDVHIQIIEASGHTPGMSVILIPEDRIILFGDACGVSVLLFDEFSSTVSEYRHSLLKLKSLEASYDRIIRNHGTGESPKELLDEVLACCDDILSKKDAHMELASMGEILFSARTVDADMQRIDGREGNILYRQDKAV